MKTHKFRLVCFDLDGTIIDKISSFWDHLCHSFGCDMKRKDEGIEKYMKSLITYDEWVQHDVELWKEKGVVRKDFVRLVKKLRLMPGAMETIMELKKRGLKIAIISDSLDIALDTVIPDYGRLFDDVLINRLFFDKNGKISGWEATKYGMEKKAEGLKMIAGREGIPLKECVFVGDGSNDIAAVKLAGLGISFNSHSEELDRAADVVVRKNDLMEILKHI